MSRIIRSPKPPPPAQPPPAARLSPRQVRTLRLLAGVLIAGGLVVLTLLARLPAPLRIIVGFTDVFAGLGLLVLVRQKQ